MGGWDRGKEVSPTQALQTAGAVAARVPKVLAVTLAALENAARGPAEVTLGSVEAAAVVAHIRAAQVAVGSHAEALREERTRRESAEKRAKSAEMRLAQAERAKNTARADVDELAEERRSQREEVEALIVRANELLGRLM